MHIAIVLGTGAATGRIEEEVQVRVMEQSGSQVAIVGDGNGALRPQITSALDETAAEPITIGAADIPERPEALRTNFAGGETLCRV